MPESKLPRPPYQDSHLNESWLLGFACAAVGWKLKDVPILYTPGRPCKPTYLAKLTDAWRAGWPHGHDDYTHHLATCPRCAALVALLRAHADLHDLPGA